MTPTLRGHLAPLAATGALIAAGIPALLAPPAAQAHPHPLPPRASAPPDRMAYVQRQATTISAVPQRTATI